MDYVEFENYYINENALQLMLAGVGLKEWYGFGNGQADRVYTKEEIHKLLIQLYQQEYIDWEEGNIRLKGRLKSAVMIIKNAPACLTIKTGEVERICYFSNGKILMLEKGMQDSNKLRFSLWEEESYMKYLWTMNIFPEEEFVESDLGDWAKDKEEIKAVFTLRKCGTGETIEEMKVSEAGIFTYITVKDRDTKKAVLYCKKHCEDMLLKWFHMEG